MPFIHDTPPRTPSPSATSISAYSQNLALRRQDQHESDILIVGAGILGTSAAITFARQGRSVTLLERSLKEPDRIVGELLQPGGVAALEELGLRECLEDIDSVPVFGYEIVFHGQAVRVAYPEELGKTTDDGEKKDNVNGQVNESMTDMKRRARGKKPEGRSFHHGRFIRRLRDVALTEPNLLVVESTANALVRDVSSGQILGVESTTQGEPDYYFASLTIISDGYASKFRTPSSSSSVQSSSKFYGLELIDCPLPSPYHGHVILSDLAPTLFYQIGTHETRALIDVPSNCTTASPAAGGVKSHLRNIVLPTLPPSVRPSFSAALDTGKLRSMPNSFLPAATNITPGLCTLGDALNMRHPLTGGGMTVALNDVVLLRNLLGPASIPSLSDTSLVLAQMKAFHWRRKHLSSVINILAMALYALFAADSDALRALQVGCFRYFQLGGACVDGPTGLLGGLVRRPFVLFYHFFAVALYGMWIYIWEGLRGGKGGVHRWSLLPYRAVMSLAVFYKACVVIFPYIISEIRA